MTLAPFHIAPLDAKKHDRTNFACGNARIDAYFQTQVSQEIRRDYARCYVAVETESNRVAGFYTLSANAVVLDQIPDALKKKMPAYPSVPAALLGWLARDNAFRGRAIGPVLLFDAIRNIAASAVASHAIITDPADEEADKFYRRFGFLPLESSGKRLYLPMKTARVLLD